MLFGACSDDGDDGGTGTSDTGGDGGTGTSGTGDDGGTGSDDGGTGSDDGGTGSDDGGTTETSTGGGTGTTTGGSTSETGTSSSGTSTGSSGGGVYCFDVGGMCVVGSEPQDCPNGMGTNEASLTYPCLGPDEQCCVPIGWECHVPPDCFFQEWNVFTQGHWGCEDNDCVEVSDFCDEPPVPPCCGDESCDHSYGENEQSCNADCT
jgi:hypothetical protein